MDDVILRMKGITKQFPGVLALDNVNFELKKGEIHSLVGENGAGKSTLMKVLGGVYKPDAGEINIEGKIAKMEKPSDSIGYKVGVIYQEFNLVPTLTVYDNMYLGRELVASGGRLKKHQMEEGAKDALAQLGIKNFNVRAKVQDLSVAMQQLVEISKAVFNDIDILVMDEPTAVLTEKETEGLFKIMKKINDDGVSIIYISHRLEEVIALSDRITVLRDGQIIETLDNSARDMRKDVLVEKMVGRDVGTFYPERKKERTDKVALEVKKLTKEGIFENISFKVHEGEILGVSGLVGAGRSEIMKSIFGAMKLDSGDIEIEGKHVNINTPDQAKRAGVALVPEDRKKEGVVLGMSLMDNICMANHDIVCRMGQIIRGKREELSEKYIADLQIRPGLRNRKIVNFSGGNQQKGVIAKWLATNPEVMIMDEPTRGIDVGAKVEIYNIINQMADEGKAVIVVSSELDELLGISDRIVVISNGHITGEFEKANFDQDAILKASFAMGGA